MASGAVGKGGNIDIQARSLSLTDGVTLSTNTNGQGDAGSVSVRATDLVSVANSFIQSGVGNEAVGKGGNINIQTRSLSLTDRTQLGASTFGRGDAGSVFVAADDSVSVTTNSVIQSAVGPQAVGKGGNIDIQARSLSLTDDAAIITGTTGQGDAGSVLIQASDFVSFVNSDIFSSSISALDADGQITVGNAGDINILTGSLSFDDADLSTSTSRQGDAGSVSIRASGRVDLASSAILSDVASGAVGKGGNIDIQASSLSLDDTSLGTNTSGQGDAGSVFIRASGPVSFTNRSDIISGVTSSAFIGEVGPEAVGNGGDINILAQSLSLNDSSLASLTAGQGNAGGVFVQTNDSVSLISESQITSSVREGGVGNGGDIDIQTRELSLKDGSQLRATVEGEFNNLPGGRGEGGDIRINATETASLSGVATDGFSSGLTTTTQIGASGPAGDITVNTGALRIADSAFVSARTRNPSHGGNITINANAFEAANGGQIGTTTYDRGQAGNITLNTTDSVTISGSDPTFDARLAQFGRDAVSDEGAASGLFARTSGAGAAGDLTITTGQFVQDGAEVSVSSVGLESGKAGNLQLTAREISLDNQGKLTAETESGQGGNITLQAQDLLRLRGNSSISTTAGTAQAGGDGGNVNINTNFIIAVPGENSDITANAFTGSGGRVEVTAEGIFGTQFRSRLTPESDITASSEFGVGGVVEINNPDVDPTQGLVELPAELVDASNSFATGCPDAVWRGESKFIITGRGGLPPNPNEPLRGDNTLTNWSTLDSDVENRSDATPDTNPTIESAPTTIVEANGWVINDKGEVFLIAQTPTVTPDIPWLPSSDCHAPQNGYSPDQAKDSHSPNF